MITQYINNFPNLNWIASNALDFSISELRLIKMGDAYLLIVVLRKIENERNEEHHVHRSVGFIHRECGCDGIQVG